MRPASRTWFALLVVSCIVLLLLLVFHEFVREPQEYAKGGSGAQGPGLVAVAEILLYAAMGAIVIGGWLMMRKTLSPLREIARHIDSWNPDEGISPLGVATVNPETAVVTVALERASARLQRAFREIREFSLKASHEIKTPLTILRGQAEEEMRRAEMRGDDSGADRMAAQVGEIDRLARILDSLGLVAKADAGLLGLKVAPGNLDELVIEFQDDLMVLAEGDGLMVQAHLDGRVPALFDRHRMRQVFLALADNAVKHNIPGGAIDVGAGIRKDMAALWIQNTCASLGEEEAGRVFEPFFRGARAVEESEGCGLGLSIARSIVQSHGGRIAFERPTEGTVSVTVFLPLAKRSAVDAAAGRAASSASQAIDPGI
jgi:signal transduction histidine kinase